MVVAPDESNETAFRREVRGPWFAWLAAHEEGDASLAKVKLEEIQKHVRKLGLRRLSDMSLAALLVGRKDLATGRLAPAGLAMDAAVALDPDLPEARWGRLAVSVRSGRWGRLPAELAQALRSGLADAETRRILVARGTLVGAGAVAATGLTLVLLLVATGARRWFHELRELASRAVAPPADIVLAVGLFLAPLLLSFDLLWLLLALFVATFVYATPRQQVVASLGLLLALPLPVVVDRVSWELALGASPFLRGAEALRESRYDQRVIDDLEAVKGVLPSDPDVRFLLGRLYQALGQNDRAVAEYTLGAQVSPAESRCLVNRGNIRFVDGDFGSAQEDFQEALKRDPRNVAARYNISLVFAETFRTLDAGEALQAARALDARLVQRFQDSPTLVKVVSQDFTVADARAKAVSLWGTAAGRRVLGHFRTWRLAPGLSIPLVVAGLLAVPLGALVAFLRTNGKGFSHACQKCGRTYCRFCKPPGESPLFCSQCVHVYLKKDGVSIETKLQKIDEVKRHRGIEGRVRAILRVALPGSDAFLEGRPEAAVLPLALFFVGVIAFFAWPGVVVVPRPGTYPSLAGRVPGLLLAAAAVLLGRRREAKG